MIHARLLRSFTFRQVLMYTSLSMGSMLILLGFIYWSTAVFMGKQIDATVQEEILGLAEQYDSRGLIGLSRIIEERVSLNPKGPAVYLLADSELRPIVGNLSAWPSSADGTSEWTQFKLMKWGRQSEQHSARARTFLLNGDLHLLVGRDIYELESNRKRILDASALGLALTTILSLGVGLLMSLRVMRRIEAVNQTSREIMEGNLSQRIPIVGSGDDFDKLAINLNHMLDRIESLMAAVRQVSDNIAHDLRTPLTRLRTRLEQVRSSTKPDSDDIDQAVDDVEELLATFNALLRIARIEAGSDVAVFAELDLSHLIEDVAELYGPVAADKNQLLNVASSGPVTIQGDRHLLFQALANLVENAIKYTPEGSTITLSTNNDTTGATVAVADNGPGIPAGLHEKVFQRFFRTDASRSTPGNGLGLSLVHAIIDLHHARIELSDNAPGLRASIVFEKMKVN